MKENWCILSWFLLGSGEKISPLEIDAVLLAHPDVSQAVAFSAPDAKYGEEVILRYFVGWKIFCIF